jgi:hypothetical protein
MPPVSVTMQPRVLAPLADAVELDVALDGALDEPPAAGVLPDDEAELWLLPHAAMTIVADTASTAVAQALCFTVTSTGPARSNAWPHVHPGMPEGYAW